MYPLATQTPADEEVLGHLCRGLLILGFPAQLTKSHCSGADPRVLIQVLLRVSGLVVLWTLV